MCENNFTAGVVDTTARRWLAFLVIGIQCSPALMAMTAPCALMRQCLEHRPGRAAPTGSIKHMAVATSEIAFGPRGGEPAARSAERPPAAFTAGSNPQEVRIAVGR